jgi:hypothetical protein
VGTYGRVSVGIGTGTGTGTAIGISVGSSGDPRLLGVAALNSSLSTPRTGVREGVRAAALKRTRATAGDGMMQSRSPVGSSQAALW